MAMNFGGLPQITLQLQALLFVCKAADLQALLKAYVICGRPLKLMAFMLMTFMSNYSLKQFKTLLQILKKCHLENGMTSFIQCVYMFY